jgi:glutamine synthetase
MHNQSDYVIRTVEQQGVRFVQLWFTDVLGVAKAFSITPAELEVCLEEGMTFDGSAIDGFSRVAESDVLAKPDPTTFQILPWRTGGVPVGRVFCDIFNLDGTPFEGCPRHVLRRTMERARERGFDFYAAPEIEYFYLKPPADDGAHPTGQPGQAGTRPAVTPVPLDDGSYFEMRSAGLAGELHELSVLTLEEMGIPVEYAQHEDAPGQHEIDLRYTDALTMADSVMTVRQVIKEIAAERGAYATFMPKPLEGVQGSGMHTHFSLFEGGTNAFFDPGDPYQLSKTAKGFIAGLIAHAPEMTAVTNQWINSYKRLVAGYEAPLYATWSRQGRSALVRVPYPKGGRAEAARVEYRAPDPACNPYLTFALVLAAGLRGIEEGYELPPETSADLSEAGPDWVAPESVKPLPSTLAAAIEEMERSSLVRETLGEHVFEWFVRNKRAESAAYRAHVTTFEIDRYLTRL